MDNALEISGLRKEFKGFVLNNVSFSLPKGYIMGFVGKNGAGKTTTIRLVLNMLRRDAGTVNVFGLDAIRDEQAIKQDVGVVFDELFLVDTWKSAEVEKAVGRFYTKWSSRTFSEYLKRYELPPDKPLKAYSRGMKLKLMLALAMSHEAKLLILDEPTSGLDPVARDELLDILGAYIADGERSVLFSTHITSDLEKIADYITLIDDGAIFYTGTKDSLIEGYRIIKGGLNDLTDELKGKIVGLVRNNEGFSGMIASADAARLPGRIVLERPQIDDILVAISRRGAK